MLEQELFEVRDLLKDLDTILEDLLNFLDDLDRVVVVLRDQLIWLPDQIELEQGVGVFVAGKLTVDLAFDLEGPGELILAHRQVTIRILTLIV